MKPEGEQKAPERPAAPDDGLSPLARASWDASPYVGAVWKLVGGAAVGVGAGYWLDERLGTKPWVLVGLSVVGIAVGFYGFIRDVLRLEERRK